MNTELLEEVRDFIVRHPRNVDMGHWVRETASCGTVGCIAAITCILSGVEPTLFTTSEDASQLLQLDGLQRSRLFYTDDWPPSFYKRLNNSEGQEYANVVAERIDHFIKTGV